MRMFPAKLDASRRQASSRGRYFQLAILLFMILLLTVSFAISTSIMMTISGEEKFKEESSSPKQQQEIASHERDERMEKSLKEAHDQLEHLSEKFEKQGKALNDALRTRPEDKETLGDKVERMEKSLKEDHDEYEQMKNFTHSLHEKGGIFVFLHIPKTGGSAVRAYLKGQVNESLYFGSWSGKRDAYKRISDYCVEGTPDNSIVVFEAHSNLLYEELSTQLSEWKDLAAKNGTPLFAFTLVREPISWYQSFFNYFLVGRGQNVTEADFVNHAQMKANMQCAELAGLRWRRVPPQSVSHKQCITSLEKLKDQMDWVFTTNKLSTELVPLISYLGQFENIKLGIIQPKIYVVKKKLKLKDFSNEGKNLLRNWTEWDMELYNNIQESYNFDLWRKFLGSQNASGFVDE